MGRIASLCAMLSIATLSNFAIPVTEVGDRVSFLITNILAFVAFQFIITSSLPMTPYLSLLDKYTLSSFVYLTVLMGVVGILSRVFRDPQTEEVTDLETYILVDNILFFVSLGVVALIQIYFMMKALYVRRLELKKLDMNMVQLIDVDSDPNDTPIKVSGKSELPDCYSKHGDQGFIAFQANDL